MTLFTRYGADSHYLGHADFEPIWAELSRRKAVVFVHPTHPVDPRLVNPSLSLPMYDYPHETGRTAMDLITRGVLRSYPGCKIILSHAGGTLPYLIHRVANMLPFTPAPIGRTSEEIVDEARESYFDTALSSGPVIMPALFEFAKHGHVLFGSDGPNAPKKGVERFTTMLDQMDLSPEVRRQVEHEGALALLPRLKPYFNQPPSWSGHTGGLVGQKSLISLWSVRGDKKEKHKRLFLGYKQMNGRRTREFCAFLSSRGVCDVRIWELYHTHTCSCVPCVSSRERAPQTIQAAYR